MNFGFYLKSLSDEKELEFVNNVVNYGIDNNAMSDASIFYDGIGFVPYFIQCGLFNSTDMWNFSGNLIIMNIDCLSKAVKIVNNINLFYYYGWQKANLFSLLSINRDKIKVLCSTSEQSNELYRLTGKYADFIINEPQDILRV